MKEEKIRKKGYIFGALVGICNGFFGGGGGMIAVPLLKKLGLSERRAHATAIFVILPLSVVSGLLYCAFGEFPGAEGWWTALGVLLGGAAGALLLSRVPTAVLFYAFTAAMAVSGAYMVFL